jgi:cysteinyl-tRNA synthetase
VLRAGEAGPRPDGEAAGVAGFGDAGEFVVSDRASAPAAPLSSAGHDLHDRFVAAIDDDLDLPTALAVVRETVRAPDVPADERRWLVLDADAVLGLDLHRAWDATSEVPSSMREAALDVPPEIAALVTDREAARVDRDFARADALRADVAAAGWEITDGPDGSTVRRQV